MSGDRMAPQSCVRKAQSRMAAACLLGLFSCHCLWAADVDQDEMNVEDALWSARASGLLVRYGVDEFDLRAGDIIQTCNGQEVGKEDVPFKSNLANRLQIVRGTATLNIEVKFGDILVLPRTMPIQKGKPMHSLPPPKPAPFGLSSLKDKPVDSWWELHFTARVAVGDNAHASQEGKVGYVHCRVELSGERLAFCTETSFDDGGAFYMHYRDRWMFTATSEPHMLEMRHEELRPCPFHEGRTFTYEGKSVSDPATGMPNWKGVLRKKGATPEQKNGGQARGTFPFSLLPGWLSLMPKEPGACCHYRLIRDWGERQHTVALLVKAEEEREVRGKRLRGWCIEEWCRGEIECTYWVSTEGDILERCQIHLRSNREQALKDLPEGVRESGLLKGF